MRPSKQHAWQQAEEFPSTRLSSPFLSRSLAALHLSQSDPGRLAQLGALNSEYRETLLEHIQQFRSVEVHQTLIGWSLQEDVALMGGGERHLVAPATGLNLRGHDNSEMTRRSVEDSFVALLHAFLGNPAHRPTLLDPLFLRADAP